MTCCYHGNKGVCLLGGCHLRVCLVPEIHQVSILTKSHQYFVYPCLYASQHVLLIVCTPSRVSSVCTAPLTYRRSSYYRGMIASANARFPLETHKSQWFIKSLFFKYYSITNNNKLFCFSFMCWLKFSIELQNVSSFTSTVYMWKSVCLRPRNHLGSCVHCGMSTMCVLGHHDKNLWRNSGRGN